ncbi:MAG TPA: AAA family ATPase [Polyangiales bacterium]|nr:AAA family ATPase [Polyangiales bacterium]
MDTSEILPPSDAEVRDLEILLRAHHPLIVLESNEPERSETLIRWVADRLGITYASWVPGEGLSHADLRAGPIENTAEATGCLDYILSSHGECLYHLQGFEEKLSEPRVIYKLVECAHKLFNHRGAILLTTLGVDIPPELQRVVTTMRLHTPTKDQYFAFVRQLLRDTHVRTNAEVKLSGEDVSRLLNQVQGLTFFEVKKVLTKILVEEQGFHAEAIAKVAAAKREIIERSGVLEYFTPEETMAEVAGLTHLKSWLAKRKLAFTHPEKAHKFGLEPPKGVLLIGVQGCGKSMCAKAIAREWGLPLIRLDPSNLYNKYFGESEKNLRRAIDTAEAMAPIVLWIDEMEKAFSHGDGEDNDSGTSTRIFGTFLSWLQDKKDGVFVVATCNAIDELPPELVRKGRFDEIFFLDLPGSEVRREILAVHLRRRGRDPARFDLDGLAARMEGYSGAEIEQVVVSSLYSAFAHGRELSTELIDEEIGRTVPLFVTAHERITHLRDWAATRAVSAD